MPQHTQRLYVIAALLALLLLSAMASCSSSSPGTSQQATATGKAGRPPGGQPSGTASPGHTVSPTSTAVAACGGQVTDVVVPTNAVLLGSPQKSGATVTCMYRISQDLMTLDTFFKTQMGASGWTLLSDNPAGPQSMVQEYFKGQSVATIILTQPGSDTHITDVTIVVETSK